MTAGTEPYIPSFEVYTRPHVFWFVIIKYLVTSWRTVHRSPETVGSRAYNGCIPNETTL